MWFDFSYDNMRGEVWRATELMKMIRELQPHILIDNRLEGAARAGQHLHYRSFRLQRRFRFA